MKEIAISIKSVAKRYTIGKKLDGSLRATLSQLFKGTSGRKSDFWALKDVSFQVERGDVVGIIGKNGAGKSTLLKILSQITKPTKGRIEINGRVASLLEVGTGFHPELTGRENIYLNGTILGMTRKEVKSKFDEIVEFSGVEQFIDTPVKHYSSGMYVRLAFAVAAHLEPEILIVDEVLAVGDAEFQKKCIGKMKDVASSGRTVLFVSHNMSSVKQLCTKGIVMSQGNVVYSGEIDDAINFYTGDDSHQGADSVFIKSPLEHKDVEVIRAAMLDASLKPRNEFSISEKIVIEVVLNCLNPVPNTCGYLVIKNQFEEYTIETDSKDILPNPLDNLQKGEHTFRLEVQPYVLPHGTHTINLAIQSPYAKDFHLDLPEDILQFSVVDYETQRGHRRMAKTSHLLRWIPVDRTV